MADEKLQIKVGDEVKYQEENDLFPHYGVVVGVYKVNYKIETEDGSEILVSKKNVWWS